MRKSVAVVAISLVAAVLPFIGMEAASASEAGRALLGRA